MCVTIPGDRTINSRLFKKKRCFIPEYLLNRDNVFVNYDWDTRNMNISFSDEIMNELSHWPARKVKWMIGDLLKGIEEFFLFQKWNWENEDSLYHHIFVSIHQVY